MPGIFSIKKSDDIRREIKVKSTVDFSDNKKIPQLEVIRQLIEKKKKEKEKI